MSEFSYLATPTATRKVLDGFDLGLKKSFGQNFLVNDQVVGKILKLASVSTCENILEIGPGIGTLTAGLLCAGTNVVAIERDARLYPILDATLKSWQKKFRLIKKDATEISVADIEDASFGALPTKLVANLPYSVATNVILDYFRRFDFLQSATVMVQREVAERICAKPNTKSYGAYTVKLSLYAEIESSFSVSANNFMPPPHVESSVIRLNRINTDAEPVLIATTCTLADAAFAQRRKTLSNSMRAYFSDEGQHKRALSALELAGIDGSRRGESLSKEEFLELGKAYLASKPS